MKHQKERNINQHINSKLQRSSYWKKKSYKEEIRNNNYGEEIEKIKSNTCAILAKRVKER